MLTRYEWITTAAVLTFATEEKPFAVMRKITQFPGDFEKNPKLARLPNMMKKAMKTLVDQKNVQDKEKFLCTHSAPESSCTR
jgi:hypothetical protein